MTNSHPDVTIPEGPFYSEKTGLSHVSFGELLQATRDSKLGPGRYPVHGKGSVHFHLVLYQDGSWRVSTPQLTLWDILHHCETQKKAESPHTLT